MNAYEYVSTKVFVKLKPSRVHGVGVFAIRDIPANTNPFEIWTGETGMYSLKEDDLKKLPRELYLHIKDMFGYGPDFPSNTDSYVKLTKGSHWIYTTPYYFINSNLEKFNLDKDTFLTTKPIQEGEELLSNYGRYERFDKKDLI